MFSIFIPTWNNFNYLRTCLESIWEHSQMDHEILVHVNESCPKTIEFLKENKVNYTQSNQNIGVCKALNNLAKIASKDYYLYLNDDMYVLPKWDGVLVKAIESKPDNQFYMSATMIEPRKGGHNCMISPHDFGDLGNNFDLKGLINQHDKIPFSDWSGASWPPSIVHKKWWHKVNGYSEEFSPGLYSDPDFAMKLWKEGIRDFHGVADSRVYHFMSKSLGKVKLNNGNKTFKKKWGIPASYFYKAYLKLGEPYQGKLPNISKNTAYWIARVKAIFA